jgi:hypothetical protein
MAVLSKYGPVLIIGSFVTAAVLSALVCLVALALYRRAVGRLMSRRGGSVAYTSPAQAAVSNKTATLILDQHVERVRPPLFARALREQRRLANVYALATLGGAVLVAMGWAAQSGISPVRLIGLSTCVAWPIVLTSIYILGWSRRIRWRQIVLYTLIYVAVMLFAVVVSPKLTLQQVLLLWLLLNGPPTVLTLAFLNTRVRSIGPIVFAFLLGACAGAWILLLPTVLDPLLERWGTHLLWLGSAALVYLPPLIGFIIMLIPGAFFIRWILRRYVAHRTSDQALTLDSMLLVFFASHVLEAIQSTKFLPWAIAALPVFAAAKAIGLRRLRTPKRPAMSLLVIRVFALGRRSARLFDPVSLLWRHVGEVRVIAGTDLANTTVQPHSFLNFVTRRLASRFINSAEALEAAARDLGSMPDPDGRFRIKEFFCYDDTWRATLNRLARVSDVVLADMRGFTRAQAGCEYELRELPNLVPLSRMILLTDEHTDLAHLHRVLEGSLGQLRPDSPNFADQRFSVRVCAYSGDVEQPLRALFAAAPYASQ